MSIVEDSNKTLRRMENNDSELKYLAVVDRGHSTGISTSVDACFWLHDGADVLRLGNAIANNTQLEGISLYESSEWTSLLDTNALFDGLQRNTTIKRLSFHGGIRNEILHESMANNSNLTDISIHNGDLREGVAGNFTSAMNMCPNLNEIRICICKVDDASVKAFALGIRGLFSLQKLRILHANAAFDGNDYSGNFDGTEGAKAIAALLQDPSCNINHLDIVSCGFSNESMQLIVNGLRDNTTLEHLRLFGSSIGRSSCESIATLLQNPNCNLTSLDIGAGRVNNESVKTIVRSLAGNTKLRHLGLSGSRIVSGCESIITLLQTPSCNLTKLKLRNSGFNHELTIKLVTSLIGNTKLEDIDLSGNNIGRSGCESIITLLQEPNSSINNIRLSNCKVDTDCAALLAQALVGNNKLTCLDLSHNGITEYGWNAFSAILSSCSNTTLCSLGEGIGNMPAQLSTLLKLNLAVEIKPLFELDTEDDERKPKALPYVIDWFGRVRETTQIDEVVKCIDSRKLSTIFQYARAMPLEFIPSPSDILLLHKEVRDQLIRAKEELEDKIKAKDEIIRHRCGISDRRLAS